MDFVIEEHIITQTVEDCKDQRGAPRHEWHRAAQQITEQLASTPPPSLADLALETPLPWYTSTTDRLQSMLSSVPPFDISLAAALTTFSKAPAMATVLRAERGSMATSLPAGGGAITASGSVAGGGSNEQSGGAAAAAVGLPALLHQDLHGGNILMSLSQSDGADAWQVDAVIDWESGAVADVRSLEPREPWYVPKCHRCTRCQCCAVRRCCVAQYQSVYK